MKLATVMNHYPTIYKNHYNHYKPLYTKNSVGFRSVKVINMML